jgi:hypothetical protein
MTHMHFTPDPPRSPAGLDRAEFLELCFRACAEWDRGDTMPSLERIRLEGSQEQWVEAINVITKHDDQQKDREVERQVQRLRAERAD